MDTHLQVVDPKDIEGEIEDAVKYIRLRLLFVQVDTGLSPRSGGALSRVVVQRAVAL
jgi:methionine synthase II (cobalamin-independent)